MPYRQLHDPKHRMNPSLLLNTQKRRGRDSYVTQRLRFECKRPGNELTIPEEELDKRLLDPNDNNDDITRRLERDEP